MSSSGPAGLGEPPNPSPRQGVAGSGAEWQRLHPLSPVVRASRGLALVVVLAATDLLARDRGSTTSLLFDAAILVLVLGTSGVAWLVTRWRIEDGVLRIDSGLIRRTSRRFPPDQLQAVDTVRPVGARILGLAEVRIRMAASTGSSGRLSYLADADAEALRARLLALAHGVAEEAPPPPERILFTVNSNRLVASILLSGLGFILEVVIVGLILLALVSQAALDAAISGGATALIALGTVVFRRLNGEYDLTVAEAPDGLRLRSGLLQTASETIPRGRVQAARIVEPLLWRPFGWCRLEVDVAGKQRSSQESRSVSGNLRAVLPVGERPEAEWLLQWIFPGFPRPGLIPPSRARWKSPLRYHYLTWGRNEAYAVTTSGRVRLVTDWIPLAKVQSIRRVEGPVQRRLRLATIHLDTAGRNVHAVARDRDRGESDCLLAELPVACRLARQSLRSG
jgi:putative membrane protein